MYGLYCTWTFNNSEHQVVIRPWTLEKEMHLKGQYRCCLRKNLEVGWKNLQTWFPCKSMNVYDKSMEPMVSWCILCGLVAPSFSFSSFCTVMSQRWLNAPWSSFRTPGRPANELQARHMCDTRRTSPPPPPLRRPLHPPRFLRGLCSRPPPLPASLKRSVPPDGRKCRKGSTPLQHWARPPTSQWLIGVVVSEWKWILIEHRRQASHRQLKGAATILPCLMYVSRIQLAPVPSLNNFIGKLDFFHSIIVHANIMDCGVTPGVQEIVAVLNGHRRPIFIHHATSFGPEHAG